MRAQPAVSDSSSCQRAVHMKGKLTKAVQRAISVDQVGHHSSLPIRLMKLTLLQMVLTGITCMGECSSAPFRLAGAVNGGLLFAQRLNQNVVHVPYLCIIL
jgi:hypothetical protein